MRASAILAVRDEFVEREVMKKLLLAMLLAPSLVFADANFPIASFTISFGDAREASSAKSLNLLGYRANLSAHADEETSGPSKSRYPLLWVGLGAVAAAVLISASHDDKLARSTSHSCHFLSLRIRRSAASDNQMAACGRKRTLKIHDNPVDERPL